MAAQEGDAVEERVYLVRDGDIEALPNADSEELGRRIVELEALLHQALDAIEDHSITTGRDRDEALYAVASSIHSQLQTDS